MQLTLDDFTKPVKAQDLEVIDPDNLPVLNDTARVRDGDILAPSQKERHSVPFALRGIDFKSIRSKAELLVALTAALPLNEYNLPKFIYRTDLLDAQLFSEQPNANTDSTDLTSGLTVDHLEASNAHTGADADDRFVAMQDALDSAIVKLDYYEGYPSIKGRPLWEKLSFESPEHFDLFKRYLEVPGARQLALVSPNLEMCTELFHLNYWHYRALAHDIFAVVHYQRMREQRILSTEDKHYLMAESMLDELKTQMTEIDWEQCKDPKTFVEVMEKLTKIQRAALGQSALGKREEPGSPSMEVTLRRVTQHNVVGGGQQAKDESGALALLDDEQMAGMAQELIIKMSQNK